MKTKHLVWIKDQNSQAEQDRGYYFGNTGSFIWRIKFANRQQKAQKLITIEHKVKD